MSPRIGEVRDGRGEVVTDEDLLAGFAAGDPRSARALVERLGPKAFGLALRELGNRAEAEDVAQEAMLRLWKIAPEWRPGEARPGTWLYRVTLNLCIDRKRRTRRRETALEDAPEPADGSPGVEERIMEAERGAALRAAMARLPDRQRLAISLRHFEGLSNPEIAETMGVGVEAVESLTARGKRALARLLEAAGVKGGTGDD